MDPVRTSCSDPTLLCLPDPDAASRGQAAIAVAYAADVKGNDLLFIGPEARRFILVDNPGWLGESSRQPQECQTLPRSFATAD